MVSFELLPICGIFGGLTIACLRCCNQNIKAAAIDRLVEVVGDGQLQQLSDPGTNQGLGGLGSLGLARQNLEAGFRSRS